MILITVPTYSIQVRTLPRWILTPNPHPISYTLYQIDSFSSSRNFSLRRQPPYTHTQLIRVGQLIASPLGNLTSAGSQSISPALNLFKKHLLGTCGMPLSVLASGNRREKLDPFPALIRYATMGKHGRVKTGAPASPDLKADTS